MTLFLVITMASGSGKGKRKENPCDNNNGSSETTLGPFPVGYKFAPTDQELIACYLWPKVQNRKLPPNLMHDIDLYQPDDIFHPEQLCARYAPQGKGEWYFFTPRDRKYPNGNRPSRSSSGGYWKASSRDVKIMSNGKHIGNRRSLVFQEGGKQLTGSVKTNWIMHEFYLGNDLIKSSHKLKQGQNDPTNSRQQLEQGGNLSKRNKLDDWVLCRIHHNTKGAKQAKRGTVEANIDNTVDNTMTNAAQFPGHPSDDPQQPTLEDVKVTYDNNPVTMPTHYNSVNYHQNGQANAYSTLEDVKVTYDNTMINPAQFLGHPSSDIHQSGPWGVMPTLENDNVVTIPPHNHVNYHQNGQSISAYFTVEDVKVTYDNTVTIPTQFTLLSEPEDVKVTYDDNTMTNPAQFPGVMPWGVMPTLENVMSANDNVVTIPPHNNVNYHQNGQSISAYDNTVTIPTQFTLSSEPEDVYITNDNTVTISLINFRENQTNDNEIGNAASVSPMLATPSEFGDEDDIDLMMSYSELFDDDMELPDFEEGFEDDLLDYFNSDDEPLTNVIVS